MKMPFGKYRDMSLRSIPTHYLSWFVGWYGDKNDFDGDLLNAIERELLKREARKCEQNGGEI